MQQNFAAVDHTLAHLHEVDGARRRSTATRAPAADRVRRGARLRQARHGGHAGGQGRPAAGHAPSRSTAPGRSARRSGRSATSPSRSRSGTRRSASSATSARWSARTPRSAPRSTSPALLGRRAGDVQVDRLQGAPTSRACKYTIQVAPEDCTGCTLCVDGLPGQGQDEPQAQGDRHGAADADAREPSAPTTTSSSTCPRSTAPRSRSTSRAPSSCSRCSSTPAPAPAAARRRTSSCSRSSSATALLIANATGCSSIYGGNLPTTPYAANRDGRGPAWSNSLFEDNAEFGLGFRLAIDKHIEQARELLAALAGAIGDDLVEEILEADQSDEAGIAAQRARVAALKAQARRHEGAGGRRASSCSPTTWSRRASGSSAATAGRTTSATAASTTSSRMRPQRQRPRARHRGLLQHRRPGVQGDAARRRRQVRRGRQEHAEEGPRPDGDDATATSTSPASPSAPRTPRRCRRSWRPSRYPGPSLIIAYSHCIAHGYDLAYGLEQQKLAVDSGVWPLYRFDPRRIAARREPAQARLGARPRSTVGQYMRNETRFRMVEQAEPGALQAPRWPPPSARSRTAFARLRAARQGHDAGEGGRGRGRRNQGKLRGTRWTSRPRTSASPSPTRSCRRLAAGRRPRHGQAGSRTRARRDRDALAVRGADHARAARHRHGHGVARRLVRRGAVLLPAAAGVRARAARIPRAGPADQGGRGGPGDRLAQRHHARRAGSTTPS